MTIETNSKEFKDLIKTVRQITIAECKKELKHIDSWISIKDTMIKLSLSRGTINEMIAQEILKKKHIGKCVRISVGSIQRYMEG